MFSDKHIFSNFWYSAPEFFYFSHAASHRAWQPTSLSPLFIFLSIRLAVRQNR